MLDYFKKRVRRKSKALTVGKDTSVFRAVKQPCQPLDHLNLLMLT